VGGAVSAVEWLDLETLAAEIATARARLADRHTYLTLGLAQALEKEIADAEIRRDHLLARLTAKIADPTAPSQTLPDDELPISAARPPAITDTSGIDETADVDPAAPVQNISPFMRKAIASETADQETTDQEAHAYEDQKLDDQKLDDQKLDDQKLDDQKLDDQIIEDPNQDLVDTKFETADSFSDATGSTFSNINGPREESNLGPFEISITDINWLNSQLAMRRAEVAARHAKELNELDTELMKIGLLEDSIESFFNKQRSTNISPQQSRTVVRLAR